MKLIRHAIYNLLGLGLPLVVAIFTIPMLIHELGDAKFGLLTLIWALVSYFGLFDLGLGRALTQQLAFILNGPNHEDSGQIIITSLALMAILGVIAALIMYIFGPIGVDKIRDLSDRQEVINSVYLMAISMPFILVTSGFRGILEAKHHFGIINAIRLPMGMFTFIGPILSIIYFGPNLEMITLVLVIGRFIGFFIHGFYVCNAVKNLHGVFSFNFRFLRPLLFSGGWFTISNVVSPFMGYIDRYLIGILISPAAIAFYATPQELITKISIIPASLNAVLFPKFSQYSGANSEINKSFYYFSLKIVFLIVLPITSCIFIFSFDLLSLWVGNDFAYDSYKLAQIFAIGIFINCLSQIPYTLIQGIGFPKITAIIHIIELPIFLILLWILIDQYGIIGAGFSWLCRITFDAIALFLITHIKMRWYIDNYKLFFIYVILSISCFFGINIIELNNKLIWVFLIFVISFYFLIINMKNLSKKEYSS